MTLSAGTRLGPYEIVAPLGAGGMGEVYRAKDTRLDRVVAIKVLPSHLSSNTELQKRLEREARAISSLSHSNICTLYDVGHQDGIDYLVMEYIEGESLGCESRAIVAWVDSNPNAGRQRYLLFIRNKTLMAQPFDVEKLQLSGEPYPVADDIEVEGESGPTGYGAFSVSGDGILSYRTGASSIVQFVWVNRLTKQSTPIGVPSIDSEPCLSPDEKRVVFGRADAERKSSDIWLLDLARGTTTRFTFAPSAESCPLWSPDGTRIVFSSNRSGQFDLYQKNSSGTGSEEVLLQTGVELYADDWSLDGRYILYESNDRKTRFDLWVLPTTGERKPFVFLQTEFNETHSQFSPDGRWVAYVSDESGRPEVYVQSFAPSGGKWQISTGGGDQPEWRRDGK